MAGTALNKVDRMSAAALRREVEELREALHDGTRSRDLERAHARISAMEVRDADRAKELARVQAELRVACRRADRELELRVAAERNAEQFHALLIQERVRKVGT